jgi:hypothetical protein
MPRDLTVINRGDASRLSGMKLFNRFSLEKQAKFATG